MKMQTQKQKQKQKQLNMPTRVLVGFVDRACVEDKTAAGLHLHMGCGESLSSRMLPDVAPVVPLVSLLHEERRGWR